MLYESEGGDIEFALTGESLIGRKLSVHREPRFLEMIEILRRADLTFTNAECLFQDWEDTPNTYGGGGAPGGTYMASSPDLIDELKWAGINLVATANNHASDFGEAGMASNVRFLNERGLAQAGMGRNLTEASAPTYVDTAKGRVAMVAACDWGPRGAGDMPWPFPMGVMAGEQSPYSKGRPGVNLIRHRVDITVDREAFNALQRISESMKWTAARDSRRKLSMGWDRPPTTSRMGEEADSDDVFYFMGTKFRVGEAFSLTTIAEAEDVERNLKWIRDARRMADWVLYSFHNHGATRTPDDPPAHSVELAHAAIDSGADIYIGHGTGRDRGMEIYNGRPIFYGLGSFMAQNDQVPMQPYELLARFGLNHESTPADFYDVRSGKGTKGYHVVPEMWETVIAVLNYDNRTLKSIRLHPIDLNLEQPRFVRGRPILAEPGSKIYRSVISRYQKMSAVFGTRISSDGIVEIPETSRVPATA